ncbi:hypothetical protein N7G274_001860 [Stereocaulon virgatum]|uniref:Uncharacterized protein n=1 Tax=Stereocaulon virgatum TaxID=373712 RepID=A0ABR4AMS5_9LECA
MELYVKMFKIYARGFTSRALGDIQGSSPAGVTAGLRFSRSQALLLHLRAKKQFCRDLMYYKLASGSFNACRRRLLTISVDSRCTRSAPTRYWLDSPSCSRFKLLKRAYRRNAVRPLSTA